MQSNTIRRWLCSGSIALALCTTPALTPLRAQNTGDPGTTTSTDRNDDGPDMGWLGLLGLVGLLGLRRRRDTHDATIRAPRT
jgi:MYXO-CTERM domain-containing protein